MKLSGKYSCPAQLTKMELYSKVEYVSGNRDTTAERAMNSNVVVNVLR